MYFPPRTLLGRASYHLPNTSAVQVGWNLPHVPHFVDCAKCYFASLVKSIESFPSKGCHCKSCESLAGSSQCIEVPWAIPWACWAIMLFSSMKCSGRSVFMNKSLTFQHLHLEGNAAWVVIIWLWKAHSFKSPCSEGAHWAWFKACWNKEEFLYRLSGLWIRP